MVYPTTQVFFFPRTSVVLEAPLGAVVVIDSESALMVAAYLVLTSDFVANHHVFDTACLTSSYMPTNHQYAIPESPLVLLIKVIPYEVNISIQIAN